MMNTRKSLLLMLTVCGISFGGTASAGDAAAGQAKASGCVGCHGMNGASTNELYPNLAGQKEAYLVKALNAYRSGDRTDPTMKAMAGSLSDTDVENLAAFFSTQGCN
jgi:cytochrome c553